ncbi:MAG: hypothetical protein MUC79_05235 [Thiobacillaceae bacterium]|jgi:hypothetical protein|nr:hypothetical protein [Thiobacillaceae bacterium]
MNNTITDCMIHVDGPLSGVEMASIADSLCANACVSGACVSESAPHLIMVSYDSECTRTASIMDEVRQRGVRAEAIGL